MSIEMNISNYEMERDSMEAEYGDEVMCVGWNPAVELVTQQQTFASNPKPTTMPAYLATANAELFLKRIYSSQR